MAKWICVLEDSSELAPLQIIEWTQNIDKRLREVIIWRSESGEVCAMEPRCPHKWTHLGVEGLVVGEELLCTDHFWIFKQDGKGFKENEEKGRLDKKGDIGTFPCKEEDGAIFIQLLEFYPAT